MTPHKAPGCRLPSNEAAPKNNDQCQSSAHYKPWIAR